MTSTCAECGHLHFLGPDEGYCECPIDECGCVGQPWAREFWPVHRPAAYDAPIPGRHWYAGCDPDGPRVGPDGVCEGCGESACPKCGLEDCPEHGAA